MTSVNDVISEDARRLLADKYHKRNMPWFAHDILHLGNKRSKQFDSSLEVITSVINDLDSVLNELEDILKDI